MNKDPCVNHTGVRLGGVSVDADIVHDGTRLEAGLHLAERDVLAELQLHEILLPVDDLERPVALSAETGSTFDACVCWSC